jgi:hypothetical protein
MTKSHGEDVYASTFQFKTGVHEDHHESLRDFLYKFAFNLGEAYEYLAIVKQSVDLEPKVRTELFSRVYSMSLQCFALSIRKMTDQSSERSVRKLISLAVKTELAPEHTKKIEAIYKHYDKFLNKFVVHQDIDSVHQAISYFPDTDVVDEDIRYLREYYLNLASEICKSYINVSGKSADYSSDLAKLVDNS